MVRSARPLQSREYGGASLTVSHRAAHEALARQRRADRIAISGTILRMKPTGGPPETAQISAEQPSTCITVITPSPLLDQPTALPLAIRSLSSLPGTQSITSNSSLNVCF